MPPCAPSCSTRRDSQGSPTFRRPARRCASLASGLCGSDVEKIGNAPAGTVLGHEVVAERAGRRLASRSSTTFRVASASGAGPVTSRRALPSRRRPSFPGGFAEAVTATAGVPLPSGIDDATGTYVEPLACVLRGAERVPRGRVLVVGHGFVGRLFAEVLRRRGDDVFAVDANPERAGRAPDGPVDAAVLCAPAAPLENVVPGGTVLVFSPAATVDLDEVYRRELTLTGSRSATPRHMHEAAVLLAETRGARADRPPARALRRRASSCIAPAAALKVVFTP